MQTLLKRAERFAGHTAITSGGERFSYQRLLHDSGLLATLLLNGKPDLTEERIACLVPPGFEFAVAQWAVWRAGGVFVPLCLTHPLAEWEYALTETSCSTIISHPGFTEKLSSLKGYQIIELGMGEVKSLAPLPMLEESRRAMIIFTSGTTGKPKGAVTTHSNIAAQCGTLSEAWSWSEHDTILSVLPYHHIHGIINVLTCALWNGAHVVVHPSFDPHLAWETLGSGEINLFMAVPTIYRKLIDAYYQYPEKRQVQLSKTCSSFRLMVSGSAALPVALHQEWQKITSHTLLERYGMTEIGMAISNPYLGVRIAGSVGLPLPGVSVLLVDDEGLPVEKGLPGELWIKSRSVFKEYWGKPEATASSFKDGWFMTGDMVCELPNGYLKIIGRKSVDIIKTGGYKVSALEIEDELLKHPSIIECAVIGVANEVWGEEIVAVLVLSKGHEFDETGLKKWLMPKLAPYKIPKKFYVMDQLPKNAIGKTVKNDVKKLL